MPKVIGFHYTEGGRLPKLTEEQKKEIMKKAEEALKANPEVKFNGTYVNEEGVGICDWEAPNAEIVEKIVKETGAPYDKVIVVEKVL